MQLITALHSAIVSYSLNTLAFKIYGMFLTMHISHIILNLIWEINAHLIYHLIHIFFVIS